MLAGFRGGSLTRIVGPYGAYGASEACYKGGSCSNLRVEFLHLLPALPVDGTQSIYPSGGTGKHAREHLCSPNLRCALFLGLDDYLCLPGSYSFLVEIRSA